MVEEQAAAAQEMLDSMAKEFSQGGSPAEDFDAYGTPAADNTSSNPVDGGGEDEGLDGGGGGVTTEHSGDESSDESDEGGSSVDEESHRKRKRPRVGGCSLLLWFGAVANGVVPRRSQPF